MGWSFQEFILEMITPYALPFFKKLLNNGLTFFDFEYLINLMNSPSDYVTQMVSSTF